MDYILWDDHIPFNVSPELSVGEGGFHPGNVFPNLPTSKKYRTFDPTFSITTSPDKAWWKPGVIALLNVSGATEDAKIKVDGTDDEEPLYAFPHDRIIIRDRTSTSRTVNFESVPVVSHTLSVVSKRGGRGHGVDMTDAIPSSRLKGDVSGGRFRSLRWDTDGSDFQLRLDSTDPVLASAAPGSGPVFKDHSLYVVRVTHGDNHYDFSVSEGDGVEPYDLVGKTDGAVTGLAAIENGNEITVELLEYVDIGTILLAEKWTSVANQRTMKIDPINPQLLSSAESGDPIVGVLGSRRKRVTLTWVGDLWGEDASLQGVYTLLDKLADRRRKVLLRIHTRPPTTKHYIYIFGILERAASVMGGRPETISATFLTDGMGQDDCA